MFNYVKWYCAATVHFIWYRAFSEQTYRVLQPSRFFNLNETEELSLNSVAETDTKLNLEITGKRQYFVRLLRYSSRFNSR